MRGPQVYPLFNLTCISFNSIFLFSSNVIGKGRFLSFNQSKNVSNWSMSSTGLWGVKIVTYTLTLSKLASVGTLLPTCLRRFQCKIGVFCFLHWTLVLCAYIFFYKNTQLLSTFLELHFSNLEVYLHEIVAENDQNYPRNLSVIPHKAAKPGLNHWLYSFAWFILLCILDKSMLDNSTIYT